MKILILDDVPEYVRSLKRALTMDYEVVSAHDLDEAKENMDSSTDLALVDVRLSEEDIENREGLSFLKWTKENYPNIPVVMMSAYKDFEAVKESWDLEAEKFLKKPINLKELRALISSFDKEG